MTIASESSSSSLEICQQFSFSGWKSEPRAVFVYEYYDVYDIKSILFSCCWLACATSKDMYPHTVKCLLYIFTLVQFGSALSSKCMFALKQLCASRNDQKHHIGSHAIPHLLESLADKDLEKPTECIYQSLLLLNMLAGLFANCELMYKEGIVTVLEELSELPAARRSDGFYSRVGQLMQSVSEIAAADGK